MKCISPNSSPFLYFKVNDKDLVIPIYSIIEIKSYINLKTYTTSNTASFIKGFFNYQKKMVPVIDLREYFLICNISFDKKIPPKTQNTHLCESAIIIITEFSNEFCGFLVDQVIDVVYFSETDLSAPPNYFPGNWISSIAITEDKIYLVMDAENFIKTELNQ